MTMISASATESGAIRQKMEQQQKLRRSRMQTETDVSPCGHPSPAASSQLTVSPPAGPVRFFSRQLCNSTRLTDPSGSLQHLQLPKSPKHCSEQQQQQNTELKRRSDKVCSLWEELVWTCVLSTNKSPSFNKLSLSAVTHLFSFIHH